MSGGDSMNGMGGIHSINVRLTEVARHSGDLLMREALFFGGGLRRGDFSGLWLRLRVFWRAATRIRRVIGYRRAERQPPQTWCGSVIPGSGKRDTAVPRRDFQLVEEETAAVTDRLIVGVNDTALGEGWCPLTSSRNSPAFSWIGRSATCFLRVFHPGSHVLQLHVSHPLAALRPPRLRLFCNDRQVGDVEVKTYRGEWWTVQFPVELKKVTATVRLAVGNPHVREDSGVVAELGLQVNEVGLLPVGSALIRPNVGRQEGARPWFVATSLNPSRLRAGLSLLEEPRRAPDGGVDFALSVQNQGDTLWLRETAWRKGYVVVGAELCDRSGCSLGEIGPRRLLDRPLFPGEQEVIRMRLQVPKGSKGKQVKIDLLDELITWFEQVGSEPLFIDLP